MPRHNKHKGKLALHASVLRELFEQGRVILTTVDGEVPWHACDRTLNISGWPSCCSVIIVLASARTCGETRGGFHITRSHAQAREMCRRTHQSPHTWTRYARGVALALRAHPSHRFLSRELSLDGFTQCLASLFHCCWLCCAEVCHQHIYGKHACVLTEQNVSAFVHHTCTLFACVNTAFFGLWSEEAISILF